MHRQKPVEASDGGADGAYSDHVVEGPRHLDRHPAQVVKELAVVILGLIAAHGVAPSRSPANPGVDWHVQETERPYRYQHAVVLLSKS